MVEATRQPYLDVRLNRALAPESRPPQSFRLLLPWLESMFDISISTVREVVESLFSHANANNPQTPTCYILCVPTVSLPGVVVLVVPWKPDKDKD